MVGDVRQLHSYGFFFSVDPRSLPVHEKTVKRPQHSCCLHCCPAELGHRMEKVLKNGFVPPISPHAY